MKIFKALIMLFLPYITLGQNETVFVPLRTQYYQLGLKTSMQHYDSLIKDWVSLRSRNKINETEFLSRYHLLENQYAQQQARVATCASYLATKNLQKQSKIFRNVTRLLSQNNLKAAIDLLISKVQAGESGVAEYQLLAKLFELSGDYEMAQKFIAQGLKKNTDSAVLLGSYARLLSINGQDSSAISIQQKYISILSDSLTIVQAKMDLSSFYQYADNLNDAQAALIEGQFLLNQIQRKDQQWTIKKEKLSSQLAQIQLSKNDFDNAFVQAKSSFSLFEQLSANDAPAYDEADRAQASLILARVYRIAGAMKESDTIYKKVIPLYENLSVYYPERFEPIQVKVLDEYGLLLQWFDQNKDYDQLLRRTADMRKGLLLSNYPFAILDYAKNQQTLAQKLVNVDVKVLLAEEQWLLAKEVLLSLYQTHPMLVGDDLCTCLFKLGGIKMAFKNDNEALIIFEQSLTIRERLYRLAPSIHKKSLLELLTQTATLNAKNKKYETAIEQLQRAQVFAQELGDTKFSEQIAQYKLELLKK